MSRVVLIAVFALLSACTEAQESAQNVQADVPVEAVSDTVVADSSTVVVFDRVMEEAKAANISESAMGEIVQWVGEVLIGTRYADGLLDPGMEESLVVDLTAFDCVLYVENVLALAEAIAAEDFSFGAYVENLESLRYREGEENGYCSRLHYFTDWIHDNDAREHVINVTAVIGGEPLDKSLNFMSTHREAYPRLVVDSTYSCIVDMESSIRDREIFYIPQDRIETVYPLLRSGDVIATATHIGGLDVTHTGFVHRTADGGVGFLHASSTGEVKVAEDLAEYIQSNSVQIGIIVARPVDGRFDL